MQNQSPYLCNQLKKTAFIFALFYLLSVVGYGLEFHYCLGQITDVNLAWLDTSCGCDTEGESVSHSCCDEKAFFVRVDDEHQSPSADLNIKTPTVQAHCLIDAHQSIEALDSKRFTFFNPYSSPPPDKLYRKHCALIYYA